MAKFKSMLGKSVYVEGRLGNLIFKKKDKDGGAIYETEDEAEIKALRNASQVEELDAEEKKPADLSKKDCLEKLDQLGFKEGVDFEKNINKADANKLLAKAVAGEVEPKEEEPQTPDAPEGGDDEEGENSQDSSES